MCYVYRQTICIAKQYWCFLGLIKTVVLLYCTRTLRLSGFGPDYRSLALPSDFRVPSQFRVLHYMSIAIRCDKSSS